MQTPILVISLSLCIHPIRFVEWNGGKRERERDSGQWPNCWKYPVSRFEFIQILNRIRTTRTVNDVAQKRII